MRLAATLAGLWLGFGLFAPKGVAAYQGNLPAAKIRAIETVVTTEMARRGIPGLSLVIVQDGQIRLADAYGTADVENSVPAKIDTVFRLASIAKPITAVAVMQLVEKGQIDLDAPIRKYVPAFPEKTFPLSVRQLLCHQAGIRTYTEGEMLSTRHFENLLDTLSLFKDAPLAFEPGTKTLYSTYGFNLLGCAIESASGQKFSTYLQQSIFKPAGMEGAREDDVFDIIPFRARGYVRVPPGELRNSGLADTSNKLPGGGLCGRAMDVARFAIALESGQLIRKDTQAKMLVRQKTRDGKVTGFGLGVVLSERVVGKITIREVWHDGGQPQVSNVLYMQPDHKFTVVLLTNLEGISSLLKEIARQIADITQK
jgi:CubicO group peptidase (beta-lactamase class C family)